MSLVESDSISGRRSKTPKEQLFKNFRNRRREGRRNNFGTVVQALAPIKPAMWLADKLGCTERAAQLYIDGKRSIPAPAVAVIVNEILE